MEKDDIIRLSVYTGMTAIYLTVFNIILRLDAYMRSTDFALYGSLIIAFTWLILVMVDLTLTIGSFSDAWVTIVSIGLGLCIIGFGIYMLVRLHKLDGIKYSDDELSPEKFLGNAWKHGVLLMPVLGGVVSVIVIMWRLTAEEFAWWMSLAYAAAFVVCVVVCAVFPSYATNIIIGAYVLAGIGSVIEGVLAVKEAFF